jgi:hypothetical protein
MGNQTTPLAVDQYSRFMVDAFDDRKIIGVPTAGQAFFGNPASGSMTLYSPDANIVDIDIIRGNEKLAAMIHRGSNARPISGQKNVADEKFTAVTRAYPLIEEEGDISANALNYRVTGEKPYSNMSKLDRLRVRALNMHLEKVRRIIRLFEYLCWQSLLVGTMPAIFGTTNTNYIYDFYRLAGHIITVATAWNQASADPLGDIDDGCELIRQNGHVNPDMLILGGLAMDAFIKDATVIAQADNRRFELIEVSTDNPVPSKYSRWVNSGLTARGRLRTPKGYTLWLFTYVDTYENSSGTAVKYLPDDQALLASSNARCDRYFGPSEVLPMRPSRAMWYNEMFGFNPEAAPMPPNVKGGSDIINPNMFYFDAYSAANEKAVTVRSQSAPIFATTLTDGFVTLKGLST